MLRESTLKDQNLSDVINDTGTHIIAIENLKTQIDDENENYAEDLRTIGVNTGDQSMDELRTLKHSKSKHGLNLRRSKEHLMLSFHKNKSQASLLGHDSENEQK